MKYGGSIVESWSESVEEYDSVYRELRLNPEQKHEFLPIILKGDARRFFKDVIREKAQKYEDVVRIITAKLNTLALQSRIKNYLNSLRSDRFMSKDVATPDAFKKLVAEIERFFPQVPPSFRCDVIRR